MIIIGMAKSSLDLNSAGPNRNLELDVLRVIYTLNKLSSSFDVRGYILVFSDEIKNRIENVWFEKYDFKNKEKVKILTCEGNLSDEELKVIKNEKDDNSTFKNSSAKSRKEITENLLKKLIETEFPEDIYVTQDFDNELSSLLSKIQWDYIKEAKERN